MTILLVVATSILIVTCFALIIKVIELGNEVVSRGKRIKAILEGIRLISNSYDEQIVQLKARIEELQGKLPPPQTSGLFGKAESPDGWERCF